MTTERIITGTHKADANIELALTTDSPSAFILQAASHIIEDNSPEYEEAINTLRYLAEAYVSGIGACETDLI